MTPGTYLQKRRVTAGISVSACARELAAIDSYGRIRLYADELRVKLRMFDAEADIWPLSPEEASLIACVVPIDPVLYRELLDVAEGRAEQVLQPICRVCAWSENAPDPPGGRPSWATPDLCSHCAPPAPSQANPPSDIGPMIRVVEPLRSPSHLVRPVRDRRL